MTETRRVLSEVKILSDHTLNLEISLKTRDGDSMVLEVWSANMDTSSSKCKNTRVSQWTKSDPFFYFLAIGFVLPVSFLWCLSNAYKILCGHTLYWNYKTTILKLHSGIGSLQGYRINTRQKVIALVLVLNT